MMLGSARKYFPLGAMTLAIAAAFSLTACNNNDNTSDGTDNTPPTPTDTTASFAELSAASTDGEKREVRASDYATIDGVTRSIGYTTILRSGEQRGADANLNVFGQIVDNAMMPIINADGSTTIADSNDFSSILQVGGKLYSVVQFESRPAAYYLTELSQDSETGELSAVSTTALDVSGIYGLWNPCAGVVTPWETHLGSEEYEPDAKAGDSSASSMATFFGGGTTLGGDATKPKAYYYGFPVEVAVSDQGAATVTKHYSMGRFAHELSYVMPDQKTVYESDDGTNVGFFMYVADTAANLSAGTLYAAKIAQTSEAGASDLIDGTVSWVKLGHASDAEIKALLDTTTFADIFDTASPNGDGTCADGYTSVNANGVGEECLSLKTGMETAAAFLESRRYAGYLGATTELRKEEGITFDPDGKRLYVSYSEIQYGMENNAKNGSASTKYDIGTSNDVKALFNSCGGVYGYDVGTDATIGSDYVATAIKGIVAGQMTTLADPNKLNPTTVEAYAADSAFAGSSCSIDGLANPDNVTFMKGQKTLLIGEDTGDGHQNDMVWAYNIETAALTRIETTPYGSETTSLYYYPDVNNFGYIMSIVQHPYGESDTDKVAPTSAERHSYFGYVGPLAPFAQ